MILLALAAAETIGGSAYAMGQPSADLPRCMVDEAGKLPAEVGGPGAICTAIVTAAQAQAPGAVSSVEVQVLSASSLAAVVTLTDGRVLPEKKMAISDRQLNRGSIERFAAAIAAEISKAGR